MRLPAIDPADLLAAESNWLARIKLAYGAETAVFEGELLPLVQRYARCVHLLPAAATGAFSRPVGLFELGLQTAFYALQGTDSRIFSGQAQLSVRQALEPRWRLATFVGGLCSELYRVAERMDVRDESGEPWPALLGPLSDWLAGRQAREFVLRWNAPRQGSRGLGLFLLPQVVPAPLLQHLSDGNDLVLPHLLASIGGVPVFPEANVLDALVRRSLALCFDRDPSAGSDTGAGDAATPVVRELLDTLRQLSRSDPAWVVNRDKSRLWWGADGAYLVWPGAAEDARRELEASGLAGMPKSSESMAQVLLKCGAIEAAANGSPTWSIQPPGARSGLDAVRLQSPALLGLDAAGLTPLPVRLMLSGTPTATTHPPPSAQRAPTAQPPIEAPSEPPERAAQPTVGVQLPLIQDDAPEAAVSSCAESASPGAGAWCLDAPLRLNPAIRHALTAALNSAEMQSRVMSTSLTPEADAPIFVPLSAIEAAGQTPSAVLRALRELGMLHLDAGAPPTTVRMVDGKSVPGLLLLSRFVRPDTEAET